MKPSEYLFNEAINSVENRKKDFYLGLLEYNEFGEDISTYKFNRKQEKELDKRFIDREELKKQINKLFFDLRQTIPKEKMKPNKKEILAIESLFYIQGEILELLK